MTSVVIGPQSAPRPLPQVRSITWQDLESKPFTVIGTLGGFREGDDEEWQLFFQRRAADLGADAIVDYYKVSDVWVTGLTCRSAVAVVHKHQNSAEIGKSKRLVVLVHPVQFEKPVRNREEFDQLIRNTARIYLTKRGYHAVLFDPDSIAHKVFQKDPSACAVLTLTLRDRNVGTVIVATSESWVLDGELSNPGPGEKIWGNRGMGGSTLGWIANMVPGGRKGVALQDTMTSLFSTFPAPPGEISETPMEE